MKSDSRGPFSYSPWLPEGMMTKQRYGARPGGARPSARWSDSGAGSRRAGAGAGAAAARLLSAGSLRWLLGMVVTDKGASHRAMAAARPAGSFAARGPRAARVPRDVPV